MKTFRHFLFLLLALTLARAEDQPTKPPERVIRDFYQWYVQALMQNRDPFAKGRAELKRYASARLIQEIDRMRKGPDGLDGDYFLDAQDFDQEWAKNISVTPPVITGNRATTEVTLAGKEMGSRKLRVTLVRGTDGWKVDKVQGENP